MNRETKELISKVPHVTLLFWIIKIFATTLGETGGDALSMSLDLGYLLSTGIFALIFIAAVAVQIKATKFHPYLYWLTIVATTTVGTTMADYATRDMGIGYTGGSAILLVCVVASLFIWRLVTGTVSVESVSTPKVEIFYWVTIMFSQTLGTALGDWFADSLDLGYLAAAAVFGAALLITYLLYRFTNVSRVLLFWIAFILTRPLGAVVGDFLDKPLDHGGLNLSRFTASAVLLTLIVAFIYIFPQKPAEKAH
ncbi:MAG: hypothetical protein IPM50_06395 [Acidobacteriota bacterium]|nr:MAG: hypothetical protein IPM50_06395 [Acidobacteriota bacterium]